MDPRNRPQKGFRASRLAEQSALEERFQALPSAESFKRHLIALTSEPHIAGTPANDRVGERIAAAMAAAGLAVETYPYDVLLSDPEGEGSVALVTPIRLPLNAQEYMLEDDPYSSHPALGPGWVAYSGSGDVTAELVYANYGRREDFERLVELGIDLSGKIVIARYGGNFRGYKAKYAEAAGAVGLIIYSDPKDCGYTQGPTYPEGTNMPEHGLQRGSLLTVSHTGDPLTPTQPALPLDDPAHVERMAIEDVGLPEIPVMPLPYGSASQILSRFQGDPVPDGWQGGLPFSYRLQGGEQLTVRLRVQQERQMRRITNVVGTIEGSELSDEWIILGCHYDAWGFGTADPNSGTAMLLCLCDALGQILAEGWRPRRTIKVAHWDGEEYGIIGSAEWTAQFAQELSPRVVAYINADMAATGDRFGASASPSLKQAIIDATQDVQRADDASSLFDGWMEDAGQPERPPIGNLGGGSDHVGFSSHLGIPATQLGLSSPCPIYHSNFDNLYWYERFADASYACGPTLARVDGLLTLRLAQADLLPYDLPSYAVDLRTHLETLSERAQARDLEASFDGLTVLAERIEAAAARWVAARDAALEGDTLTSDAATSLNQALIALERPLVHAEGLQESAWARSLWACEDPFSGYAAWMLPGLRYEIETRSPDGLERWKGVYARALTTLAERIEGLVEEIEAQ